MTVFLPPSYQAWPWSWPHSQSLSCTLQALWGPLCLQKLKLIQIKQAEPYNFGWASLPRSKDLSHTLHCLWPLLSPIASAGADWALGDHTSHVSASWTCLLQIAVSLRYTLAMMHIVLEYLSHICFKLYHNCWLCCCWNKFQLFQFQVPVLVTMSSQAAQWPHCTEAH